MTAALVLGLAAGMQGLTPGGAGLRAGDLGVTRRPGALRLETHLEAPLRLRWGQEPQVILVPSGDWVDRWRELPEPGSPEARLVRRRPGLLVEAPVALPESPPVPLRVELPPRGLALHHVLRVPVPVPPGRRLPHPGGFYLARHGAPAGFDPVLEAPWGGEGLPLPAWPAGAATATLFLGIELLEPARPDLLLVETTSGQRHPLVGLPGRGERSRAALVLWPPAVTAARGLPVRLLASGAAVTPGRLRGLWVGTRKPGATGDLEVLEDLAGTAAGLAWLDGPPIASEDRAGIRAVMVARTTRFDQLPLPDTGRARMAHLERGLQMAEDQRALAAVLDGAEAEHPGPLAVRQGVRAYRQLMGRDVTVDVSKDLVRAWKNNLCNIDRESCRERRPVSHREYLERRIRLGYSRLTRLPEGGILQYFSELVGMLEDLEAGGLAEPDWLAGEARWALVALAVDLEAEGGRPLGEYLMAGAANARRLLQLLERLPSSPRRDLELRVARALG